MLKIGQESGRMVGLQRVASREGAKSAHACENRKTDAGGIGLSDLMRLCNQSTVSVKSERRGLVELMLLELVMFGDEKKTAWMLPVVNAA